MLIGYKIVQNIDWDQERIFLVFTTHKRNLTTGTSFTNHPNLLSEKKLPILISSRFDLSFFNKTPLSLVGRAVIIYRESAKL